MSQRTCQSTCVRIFLRMQPLVLTLTGGDGNLARVVIPCHERCERSVYAHHNGEISDEGMCDKP